MQVRPKLASTSKHLAPTSVLFPHDNFRAITAQRNDRSARLFVGSAAGSYKHPNNDSALLPQPILDRYIARLSAHFSQ